jgi:hypothetical protein
VTRSTSQLRVVWAPACEGPFAKVTLYGGGVVVVDPLVVPAVKALDACLRHHGYEATAPDVGAYNCRPITGGTAYSLHAYGIALDINWQANPYGKRLVTDMPEEMRSNIKAIRTVGGHQVWRWGGDYAGNKDAMHFEVVASPTELASGIDPSTVPFGTPAPEEPPMAAKDHCHIQQYPNGSYLLGVGQGALSLTDKTKQKYVDKGVEVIDCSDDVNEQLPKLKRDLPGGLLFREGDTFAAKDRAAFAKVIKEAVTAGIIAAK